MRKLLLLSVFTWLIAPIASEGAPISVNCPGTVVITDREFIVTTDPLGATCLDSGNDANELNANIHDVLVADGWTVIDKDDTYSPDNWFTVFGIGATEGGFVIDPAAWAAWDQIAIGFVVGGGQIGPKWAAFGLPDGETFGLWSNAPNQGGGLSHANLYGRADVREITAVPEPATLFLLGSGLTVAARRKRAKR